MTRRIVPVVAVRAGDLIVGDWIAIEMTRRLCPMDLFDPTMFMPVIDVRRLPDMGIDRVGIAIPDKNADPDGRRGSRTRVLHERCIVLVMESKPEPYQSPYAGTNTGTEPEHPETEE